MNDLGKAISEFMTHSYIDSRLNHWHTWSLIFVYDIHNTDYYFPSLQNVRTKKKGNKPWIIKRLTGTDKISFLAHQLLLEVNVYNRFSRKSDRAVYMFYSH